MIMKLRKKAMNRTCPEQTSTRFKSLARRPSPAGAKPFDMKYYGIVPTSSIPDTCVHKELHHEAKFAGRMVQYWEVWIKDRDEVPRPFGDGEELNKRKVRDLDRIFNNSKNKFK